MADTREKKDLLRELLDILGTDQTKVSVMDPRYESRLGGGMALRGAINSALSNTIDAPANLWNAGWGRITGTQAPTIARAIPGLRGEGAAYDAGSSAIDAALMLGATHSALGGSLPGSRGGMMPANQVGAVGGDDAAKMARVIAKFGQKVDREAALAEKVAKANAALELGGGAPKGPVKKAERAAIEPDHFRRMQDQIGEDATMRAILGRAHLRADGKGGYIGAPRTVVNQQGLGALRSELDQQFVDAAEAISVFDRNRLGTWYDRAKVGQKLSNEPWQLPRSLDQHAVYSAGVSQESELAFALKHGNSRALGEPTRAYRGPGARTLDSAVAENRPADLAAKVGEYRVKNNPAVPNGGLFGVNDFRAAQTFGYTTPDGAIWRGGVSDTMHPFMDGETALMVHRANRKAIEGRADWKGPHIQEIPWVYGKAQDLYEIGKNGRFSGPPEVAYGKAISEANNTLADYFHKHAASATYEAVPGRSTGHVPSLLDADLPTKVEYGNVGRWDRKMNPGPGLSDDREIDAIYSAMGVRQLPTIPSTGAYVDSAGKLTTEPMKIARPLVDFPTGGGGGRMSELTSNAMGLGERFRAVADAQEAGAFNLPNTLQGFPGKNAMLIDTRPARETLTGVQPTAEQLRAVGSALPEGFGVTATNRGALVFPFDGATPAADATKAFKAAGPAIDSAFPGAQKMPGIASTGYVPGIGKYDAAGNVVPTAPYSGEATMGLLSDAAKLPPTVARNLSESEEIRNILREKIARDARLPGARGDIQNTRNFLAEADWGRAVEMIRKGVPPAAAISALGYSASSMAEER